MFLLLRTLSEMHTIGKHKATKKVLFTTSLQFFLVFSKHKLRQQNIILVFTEFFLFIGSPMIHSRSSTWLYIIKL